MSTTRDPALPAGVLGLGELGGPLARRLSSAPRRVLIHDSDPRRVRQVSDGWPGLVATDLSGVCAAPILFCLLPDTETTADVLGQALSIGTLQSRSLVIDMSTADPSRTTPIRSLLAQHSVAYLAATVLRGGGAEAGSGSLALAVGGAAATRSAAQPWLEEIGHQVAVFDTPEQAQAIKLVNNFVALGTSALLAEAVAIARAMEVDRDTCLATLNEGSAGSWVNLQHVWDVASAPLGPSVGFRAALAAKDLRYLATTAMVSRLPAPIAAAVHQWYVQAEFSGHGHTEAGTWPWRFLQLPAGKSA